MAVAFLKAMANVSAKYCDTSIAGRGEEPPIEEAMQVLSTWRDVSKEDLLLAFEGGNFAGIEEMKRNDRLFERVAPMAVNDIMMAVQYK